MPVMPTMWQPSAARRWISAAVSNRGPGPRRRVPPDEFDSSLVQCPDDPPAPVGGE